MTRESRDKQGWGCRHRVNVWDYLSMTCNYILDYPANLNPSKDPALIFTWLFHVMNPSFTFIYTIGDNCCTVSLVLMLCCDAGGIPESVLGENFLLVYTFFGSQYTFSLEYTLFTSLSIGRRATEELFIFIGIAFRQTVCWYWSNYKENHTSKNSFHRATLLYWPSPKQNDILGKK